MVHLVSGKSRRRAFTIIELLVVVAIIAVLVAILIPTLSTVKAKAREAATRSLLSNLQSNIETYYTTFHAYPGPTPINGTAGGARVMSGTQNLLLGLSYSLYTAGGGTRINVPGGTMFVDPNTVTGPINYSVIRPNGQPEQLAPFYSPPPQQISLVGATPAAAWGAFPAIYDTYPDALPILYYRRTPGVDFVAGKPGVLVTDNPAAGVAPYFLDDNKEYTTATSLAATNGQLYPQGSFTVNDLTTIVQSDSGANRIARGGYVLISAGTDRTYGTVNGKFDDISQVGGH